MPTVLFTTCCAIEATCWLIGYALGSWLGGLVVGAFFCGVLIWELGQ
jgi:predicted MFS family arabinose efflux permease